MTRALKTPYFQLVKQKVNAGWGLGDADALGRWTVNSADRW